MEKKKNVNIILTKEEIGEIFNQAFETQKNQDFRNFPVIVFSIWIDRVVQKTVNQMGDEYDKASAQFKHEVEKAAKDFDNVVASALDKFLQQ